MKKLRKALYVEVEEENNTPFLDDMIHVRLGISKRMILDGTAVGTEAMLDFWMSDVRKMFRQAIYEVRNES